MTAPFLALDTAHHRATGLWTLYNRPCALSFTFDSLDALRAFLEVYHARPIAALFAYNATIERTLTP